MVIIHRGKYSRKYPENSIPAFLESVNNNKCCELDLHILKCGTVVVFHDDNLSRMCGIDRNIKDMTYEEIKNYKLANSVYSIPTFKEVLDLVNGKVMLDIELKYDVLDHSLENQVISLLKNYKGEYILKSFHPKIVRYLVKNVKKNNMNTKVGLLVNNSFLLMFCLIFIRFDYISYNYKLRDKWIYKFASKLKPTLLYTIKDRNVYNILKNKCYGLIVENYEDLV